MIRYTTFKHGWFYNYYVDVEKSLQLSRPELHEFLLSMFLECPHNKFECGPRSSSLKRPSGAEVYPADNHEICTLAKEGLAWGMQGTAHGNVQLFMLKNDPKTIGVEVPVWLDEEEYKRQGVDFGESGPLTGHIDLLRVEGGKIWVWDFKPNAHREKFADTQTYFYALMLSIRTGIDLQEFRCGYFDEKKCYVFDPSSINSSKVTPLLSSNSAETT